MLKFLTKIIHKKNTAEELIEILNSAIDLLSLPGNNFTWSSWNNQQHAIESIAVMINEIRNNNLRDKNKLSVLFAPTGPLQEVSLSSGWSDEFIRLANRFDKIKNNI